MRGVLWWYFNLKSLVAMRQARYQECASMTEKLKGLRSELVATIPVGKAGPADKVTDVAAESSEAQEPGSGPLEGVMRTGLWGEVLAGTVVESSAKLESVVVRACGNLATVPLNGNRPAPKAKAKAAAKAGAKTLRKAGAAAAPAGRWFWSNLDTLELKLHSSLLPRTVVALIIMLLSNRRTYCSEACCCAIGCAKKYVAVRKCSL